MKFRIFDNYDPQKLVGSIEFNDEFSPEVLADSVVAPMIKLGEENEIISWGIFRREALDTSPRS